MGVGDGGRLRWCMRDHWFVAGFAIQTIHFSTRLRHPPPCILHHASAKGQVGTEGCIDHHQVQLGDRPSSCRPNRNRRRSLESQRCSAKHPGDLPALTVTPIPSACPLPAKTFPNTPPYPNKHHPHPGDPFHIGHLDPPGRLRREEAVAGGLHLEVGAQTPGPAGLERFVLER